MDGYLDLIFDKYLLVPSTKIDFRICDTSSVSIISLLIKYDYSKYIELIINKIGKDIFKHIPMFTINKVNLSYSSQLSNGHELYWACKKNLKDIAWFFVSNKLGNINHFDSDGNSSLILACMNNMNNVAETLLNSNLVDWRRKNIIGKTALDYASENKMIKIIEIIEEKKEKNQNIFPIFSISNQYNCEIKKNNKSENTNIDTFYKKEITINNLEDISKLLDKFEIIYKKN
jgi:ankyrin repeat protein